MKHKKEWIKKNLRSDVTLSKIYKKSAKTKVYVEKTIDNFSLLSHKIQQLPQLSKSLQNSLLIVVIHV